MKKNGKIFLIYRQKGDDSIMQKEIVSFSETDDNDIVPEPIHHVFWQQILNCDFLDAVFDCPFEIHKLIEDDDIADPVFELKDLHKEVLYYSIIRQESMSFQKEYAESYEW